MLNKKNKTKEEPLTQFQRRELLEEAFRAICNMSMAKEKDNHASCHSFHIEPFHTHWDKKTVKEVKYNVDLYINTWVIRPMEKALGLSRTAIKKEMKGKMDTLTIIAGMKKIKSNNKIKKR